MTELNGTDDIISSLKEKSLLGLLLPSIPCWAFLVDQAVKNLSANAGGQGLIPGWGRSLGEGNSYPPQYSCLKNPMDSGARQVTFHAVAEFYMTED